MLCFNHFDSANGLLIKLGWFNIIDWILPQIPDEMAVGSPHLWARSSI